MYCITLRIVGHKRTKIFSNLGIFFVIETKTVICMFFNLNYCVSLDANVLQGTEISIESSGVPHVSYLGPLLSLLYTNTL